MGSHEGGYAGYGMMETRSLGGERMISGMAIIRDMIPRGSYLPKGCMIMGSSWLTVMADLMKVIYGVVIFILKITFIKGEFMYDLLRYIY